MNTELEVISTLYKGLISKNTPQGIPVNLRPAQVVGTVQDDPFDCWVETLLKSLLPKSYEVFHAGKLTTPDLIMGHKTKRVKRDGSVEGESLLISVG